MQQRLFFLLVLIYLNINPILHAQVVVNEYSAANWKLHPDNHSDYEDWIELYNAGSTSVDLSGYYLSDKDDAPLKWKFKPGSIIGANDYLLVFCSGRDTVQDNFYHTNFRLTQTNNNPEHVVFSNASGTVINNIEVQRTTTHQSRCRQTDGANIWRICTNPTPDLSNDSSPQFVGFADRPSMNQTAGFYTGPVEIAMETDEPGGEIRYTLDGREPNANSTLYTAPITISATTVVKARTFSPNPTVLPSFIQFNTYFINESSTMAIFSIAADTLLELANGNKELRPVGTIEYFDKNGVRLERSYGELNSHGQDSWVNDQRSLDWISRDEMGYSKAIEEQLFAYSPRDEYQRIIFRASGDDNYPATTDAVHDGNAHIRDDYVQTLALLGNMRLDTRASERCLVFLNGEYWGVYSIREIPDEHDYTDFYYNQGKYDLQYLLTWGETWAEYGGNKAFTDWASLRSYILGNSTNLADSTKYAYAENRLDMLSLTDYFLLNLNVVCTDWINYNTGWWRGLNPNGDHKKWGYILWDNDASFGYYINYTGIPNTTPTAKPCDLEDFQFGFWGDDPGKHEKIIEKLLDQSPIYQQLYLTRAMDLRNTVFSCENMLTVFDSMIQVIAPEMPRHIDRWQAAGSLTEWETNVQALRDYITERCALLDEGLVECYDLNGPFPLVVQADPPTAVASIRLNTLTHEQLPWQGEYFSGTYQELQATPALGSGLVFSHWSSSAGTTIFADSSNLSTRATVTEADTLTAHFRTVSSVGQLDYQYALNVFPTLTTDQVQVQYQLRNTAPVRLRWFDTAGRQVGEQHFDQAAGQQTQRLSTRSMGLAPGMYLMEFSSEGYRKTTQITVVK
jgi:CotH kinase protein/Lamin Tail Domain/Chitobiase/beta-hexosaminidase C-terminal domain/Divergent InlB B-repeat domain